MPKIVDRDRYRRELLAQCLSLFAEKGFSAVTMRQVAASLSVSTGTLYHYFPNKESIFVQLVDEYCSKDVAKFFAQAPDAATSKEKLHHVMAFFIANYGAYQQQLLIWIDFYQHCQHTGKGSDTVLQQFWQQTHQQLMTYLQIAPEQVDCLLTYLDGLLLQCLYGRSNATIARQAHAFCDLFTNGWAATDASESTVHSDNVNG
jgi:AcrR family transcriptional regulator